MAAREWVKLRFKKNKKEGKDEYLIYQGSVDIIGKICKTGGSEEYHIEFGIDFPIRFRETYSQREIQKAKEDAQDRYDMIRNGRREDFRTLLKWKLYKEIE